MRIEQSYGGFKIQYEVRYTTAPFKRTWERVAEKGRSPTIPKDGSGIASPRQNIQSRRPKFKRPGAKKRAKKGGIKGVIERKIKPTITF
jgi:hypothetical protein